jgi:hypothetical protein
LRIFLLTKNGNVLFSTFVLGGENFQLVTNSPPNSCSPTVRSSSWRRSPYYQILSSNGLARQCYVIVHRGLNVDTC